MVYWYFTINRRSVYNYIDIVGFWRLYSFCNWREQCTLHTYVLYSRRISSHRPVSLICISGWHICTSRWLPAHVLISALISSLTVPLNLPCMQAGSSDIFSSPWYAKAFIYVSLFLLLSIIIASFALSFIIQLA